MIKSINIWICFVPISSPLCNPPRTVLKQNERQKKTIMTNIYFFFSLQEAFTVAEPEDGGSCIELTVIYSKRNALIG